MQIMGLVVGALALVSLSAIKNHPPRCRDAAVTLSLTPFSLSPSSPSPSQELRLHSQAEIQVLYPVLTQRLGPGEGAVLAQRALAEHAMVEASIEEMLRLRGSGDKDALIARVKQAQTELMT